MKTNKNKDDKENVFGFIKSEEHQKYKNNLISLADGELGGIHNKKSIDHIHQNGETDQEQD